MHETQAGRRDEGKTEKVKEVKGENTEWMTERVLKTERGSCWVKQMVKCGRRTSGVTADYKSPLVKVVINHSFIVIHTLTTTPPLLLPKHTRKHDTQPLTHKHSLTHWQTRQTHPHTHTPLQHDKPSPTQVNGMKRSWSWSTNHEPACPGGMEAIQRPRRTIYLRKPSWPITAPLIASELTISFAWCWQERDNKIKG